VYAFEPRDSLCDDILKNLKLNNRKNNVVIKKKGLGRKKCKIPFNEHSGNFNQGVGMYDPDSKSEIEVVALDEELKSENRPVSLIKVDVEGMEFDVIRGAENILKKWKPVLLIEHNSPPWKLDEFVEAIPYSVKIFRVPNNLRECMKEITLGDRMSGLNNLLFLPR
jgi:FkbM family methyltransferase